MFACVREIEPKNVRKPALLRQVFAVAAGSPAQIISLQKMQGQLQDSGALETVAHYLALLQDAYPRSFVAAQAIIYLLLHNERRH